MTTPLPIEGALISLADANNIAGRFGQTVTQEQVSLAELTISLRTATPIYDQDTVDAMDETDRYWLAQAIVFQAIWQKGQPDLLTRIDASQTETDGDAMALNHDALILAPMAKWALKHASNLGWNTVNVEPDQRVLGTGMPARNWQDVGWRRLGYL